MRRINTFEIILINSLKSKLYYNIKHKGDNLVATNTINSSYWNQLQRKKALGAKNIQNALRRLRIVPFGMAHIALTNSFH